jgi:hypothetical protein
VPLLFVGEEGGCGGLPNAASASTCRAAKQHKRVGAGGVVDMGGGGVEGCGLQVPSAASASTCRAAHQNGGKEGVEAWVWGLY